MKKVKKHGFTLVELLAVIVVLAIILVIAVPKILDVIKSSRENSLISSVKLIARNAEQKLLTNEVLGEDTDTLNCDDVADLSQNDYKSCTIDFDGEGNATVSITGKGKFSGYTCSGTKNNVTCSLSDLSCGLGEKLDSEGNCICKYGVYHNEYYVPTDKYDQCMAELGSYFSAPGVCSNAGSEYGQSSTNDFFISRASGMGMDDLLVENGGFLEKITNECIEYNFVSGDWAQALTEDEISKTKKITFHKSTNGFDDTGIDVSIGNTGSIKLYKSETIDNMINLDIVSDETIYFPKYSGHMFYHWNESIVFSNLEEIDFNNSINTSEVIGMSNLFTGCSALTSLDLSSFDTSKVTDMSSMFNGCINLEHIYVGDNWDTSKVEDSRSMFGYSSSTFCVNLPNFDDDYTDKTKAYVGEGGYLESCTQNGYKVKSNLTESQKNSCVTKISNELVSEADDDEWALQAANVICKNEYPEDMSEEEFYEGAPFVLHNRNGLLTWFIDVEEVFEYADVSSYADNTTIDVCTK